MRICIAGASGCIGRNLVDYLREEKHELTIINRSDFGGGSMAEKLGGCECLINLTGESIAGIWTKRKKRRIYNSRVFTTRVLTSQVIENVNKLKIFINVSGVGIYDRSHKHDERSLFYEDNFLSGVIKDWENALMELTDNRIRKVILRLGIVLGSNGGIMQKVILPFRFGLGYTIKSQENLPFIHIADLLGVFKLVLTDSSLSGIVNVVSPKTSSIQDFYHTIGNVLKCKIRICFRPAFINAIMGDSGVILTQGQHVIPGVLRKKNFLFKFPEIRRAINDIL